MKLKIKKTGEILEDVKFIDTTLHKITIQYLDDGVLREYSIKNLSDVEEIKDYEEPKSGIEGIRLNDVISGRHIVEIDFTKVGEAEKAVDKLKAWVRLKDKGFRFNGVTPMEYFIRFTYDKPRQILDNQQYPEVAQQFNKDLNLLFGGEE